MDQFKVGQVRARQAPVDGLLKHRPDLFDAPSIHAQIGIPDARSGAHVNHLAVTIEQEFDIIDKAKNKASKLYMPVCLCLLDKGRIPGFQHRLPKS